MVVREVRVTRSGGGELQPCDGGVVDTDGETGVEHPVAGTYITDLLQGELLSDRATAWVDRRRFLRVDVEPLDVGAADSLLLVVSKVEAREGIDLRREAQVKVREEAEALEARVDLDTALVIETRADEVAHVVVPPRGVEVSRGHAAYLEDVLPPVRVIVIEGIQRVLCGGRGLVVLRQYIPVTPEVVVSPVEGRFPAVGFTIAAGEDVAVGRIVVVTDTLVLCEDVVHAALTVTTHLQRRGGEEGDGLREVQTELCLA